MKARIATDGIPIPKIINLWSRTTLYAIEEQAAPISRYLATEGRISISHSEKSAKPGYNVPTTANRITAPANHLNAISCHISLTMRYQEVLPLINFQENELRHPTTTTT